MLLNMQKRRAIVPSSFENIRRRHVQRVRWCSPSEVGGGLHIQWQKRRAGQHKKVGAVFTTLPPLKRRTRTIMQMIVKHGDQQKPDARTSWRACVRVIVVNGKRSFAIVIITCLVFKDTDFNKIIYVLRNQDCEYGGIKTMQINIVFQNHRNNLNYDM